MTITNFKKQLPNHLDWLIPTDVELVRIGNDADGGYLVPKIILKKADALVSLGLGENWTFDEEWHALRPNDPIHMYDGTVTKSSLPQTPWQWPDRDLVSMYEQFFNCTPGVRHYVEMIGRNRAETDLETCINRIDSNNIFIKMDIEGGEYTLIDDIVKNKNKIVGIAAEMHFVNTNRALFHQAMLTLRREYAVVHVHSNIGVAPQGVEGLNDALEITFLRKDFCAKNPKRYELYKPGLDFVNHIGLFDIEYYFEQPDAK